MSSEVMTQGGPVRGSGRDAFIIYGVAFLVVAAVIAVLQTVAPIAKGWWLVSYLSLVGGVSQILLGRGLLVLAQLRGAAQPDPRRSRLQLLAWNAGTLTVGVADIAGSAWGVLVGSVLLLAALALFTNGVREMGATARQPATAWVGSYGFLIVFLAISTAVGTLLAFAARG